MIRGLSANGLLSNEEEKKMLLEGNLGGVQHLGIPVVEIEQAKAWYTENLGFSLVHEPSVPTDEGEIRVAFLEQDDLVIELYQLVGEALEEVKTRGQGNIDHFAIDVLDIEKAIEEVRRKGVAFDESTPGEPVLLDMFWSKGVKYIFLKGPSGEKAELNQRLDLDPFRRKSNFGGWSHLGIPVADVEKSLAFYRQFGFREVMRADIPVDGEAVKVRMMEKAGFILEFYQLTGHDLEEIKKRGDGHIDHIALEVEDADRAYEELKEVGVEILENAPVQLPFWKKGVKYFNIRGPDGEKVEFNEKIA